MGTRIAEEHGESVRYPKTVATPRLSFMLSVYWSVINDVTRNRKLRTLRKFCWMDVRCSVGEAFLIKINEYIFRHCESGPSWDIAERKEKRKFPGQVQR